MEGFLNADNVVDSLEKLRDALLARIFEISVLSGIDPETLDVNNPPSVDFRNNMLSRLCETYVATVEKLEELNA